MPQQNHQAGLGLIVTIHGAGKEAPTPNLVYTGPDMLCPPQTGVVLSRDGAWLSLETGHSEIFLIEQNRLEALPALGATVTITPYARRRFDGTRVLETTLEDRGARLPIEKYTKGLCSGYLTTLIAYLETTLAPDGVRYLSDLLVDANAHLHALGFKDIEDEHAVTCPPGFEFRVATKKHQGPVRIYCLPATDGFEMQLIEPGSLRVLGLRKGVFPRDLGPALVEMVDDGRWQLAKVEVHPTSRTGPKRAV